ncbi:hypothetical protein T484DRAFT_2291783 [Baffinella frigidus]|nr:hypothetical protein T484DRAFT_2291783 [Cryptophyta sp. CCMP2293]
MESDWDLVCAICIDSLNDPVVAGDTRIYCRKCIKSWFRSLEERGLPRSSPWTRAEIGEKLSPSPVVIDRHFMLAGANVPSILTLRSVFAHLDPLRDILAASLEGWQPPQVVMIGQESSGKSSILERLAMMPLFPRGDDITTRLPIHVHLRNAESSLPPTLEVVDTATNTTVRGPYVVPAISGHLDVSQQMDEILREEQRGLHGVSSTRRIVLHIENRHVPSIDLVDLPGIVAAGENSAGTKALAEEHIRLHDKHSIYLLTCPAASGPNVSVALDMVIRQGLQGSATCFSSASRPSPRAATPTVRCRSRRTGGSQR